MKKISGLVRILSLGLLLIPVIIQNARAAEDNSDSGTMFYVNDPTGRNAVVFKSEAPLEDIVGTTSEITGYMMFDPLNPQAGGQGKFMVPVTSLDSGIPLRDEHLQGEAWLNAAAHPMIILTIDQLKDVREVKITDDTQTYDVIAVGNFSLHGVSKNVEVPGRITFLTESEATSKRLPGHILAARSEFTVILEDYGITGPPGIVGSKVGESIDIEVRIMGSTGSEQPVME